MSSSLNISEIEAQKENIEALPGGRSVSSLTYSLKQHGTHRKDLLNQQRQEFEDEVADLDDLDDPLEVYVRYIRWCHDSYPQGNNAESRLLEILEKCTTDFRDFNQYKNDSRYLKIWLEYAKYSDSPTEIFIYLAKKEIGRELSLYYEEFAKVLELRQKFSDAQDVYHIGLQNNARPVSRLIRSSKQFELRKSSQTTDRSDSEVKRVLTLKRGSNPSPEESMPATFKKSKISVFTDDSNLRMADKLFDGKAPSKDILDIQLRKKENVFTPRPWSGEILEQIRPSSSSSSSNKIPVYRDIGVPVEEATQYEVHLTSPNEISTIVKRPGKKPEQVHANLDLIYPEHGEEVSLVELLMLSRTKNMELSSQVHEETLPTQGDSQSASYQENARFTDTFTIPLKDDDTTTFQPRNILQSPTVTLYSKAANNEVMSMFNDVSKMPHESDFEDDKSEGGNSTNYDEFVTETLHKAPAKLPTVQDQIVSSSHIDSFGGTNRNQPQVVDPLSEKLREKLLSGISPPLETYPGYNNTKTHFIEAIRKFRSITDKDTKIVAKGSSGSIVNFCGDEIFSLKCELGQGGYGYVYLIENEVGMLKALKAETISSNWEFYILNQLHRRLKHDPLVDSRLVNPESLYMYKDESFLILNYLNQGTLLDLVNYYKGEGDTVEEILCIFFTIELLRVVEQLHRVGVIHGDLKADNCMIDLKNTFSMSEHYDNKAHEANEWQSPRLVLIDFGRAIDLTLFPEGTEFSSDFRTDEQDCPQMREHKTWSYEADYYGIAATIHTLLFGDYIRVNKLPNGKYKLQNSLRRYWQLPLWQPLFEILLNPYYNVDEKIPLIDELKYQRVRFEEFLKQNSAKLGLKRVINNIERDVYKIIPKRR
ncbi:protein kinase [Yamadazyma tenuis]|uniref:Uncharacterized protein n=1 Tax=Candida tenuis (strain ATCC 10573 / BCRC 21748 / CBS 615 / JCM 9827 / NBRC 10315 / NRRL Y-1498 / VKM Y-70) TaxID=590646 RepID=G3BF55_CANTC|nr:uncharacterized protein CANTEDRAFT_109854 [Yamadazyma tenuis ATCC 10573]EGV60641.1 hypothetical protein CANTEDRAFT_109854 [Yamadazyma tenuis ATCC 10573]WEJ94108.1 protein kinase [Yamadazyma tenuis]